MLLESLGYSSVLSPSCPTTRAQVSHKQIGTLLLRGHCHVLYAMETAIKWGGGTHAKMWAF